MKTTDKIEVRGGFLNWIIMLVCSASYGVLSLVTGSITAFAVWAFMGVAFVVATISLLHMYLKSREQLEARELEEIQAGATAEALFEEGQVLPAKRSCEQFETWGIPIATVVMFVLQVVSFLYVYFSRFMPARETIDSWMVDGKYVALFGAALIGLIMFLRGQYASNLARIEKQRFLQPASDYILFLAYLNFVWAAVVAVSFKNAKVDVYVGGVLMLLLAFTAIEYLLSAILEIFRPKVAGKQKRLLYQSRMVGLVAKPENLFTSVGHVLDYQFGFKVSQTSGYQFLRERLGIVIGLQIIVLWLSTTVVVVEPSERGRLVDGSRGEEQTSLLEPGFHLKLPWPFASVEKFNPDQVHTFHVGLEPLSEDEIPPQFRDRPGLWLEPSGKDYDSKKKTGELFFLVGSGDETVEANLMVASVPVQYRIRSEKEGDIKGLKNGWLRYSQPEELLKNIATGEVVNYFLNHDFEDLLIKGRKTAQEALKNSIQEKVNDMGVEILFVGVANLRPPAESPENVIERGSGPGEENHGFSPVPVAAAFEKPIADGLFSQLDEFEAGQEKMRLDAERTNEVGLIEYDAKVTSELLRMEAKARSQRQTGSQKPFNEASNVYPLWLYLTTFERAVEHARKFVIASQNHDVEVDLDLHEAIRRDMTDIKVPSANNKK